MRDEDPDYWMIAYEKWRNITADPLYNLRPRCNPPVSAFVQGNPYGRKVIERRLVDEMA